LKTPPDAGYSEEKVADLKPDLSRLGELAAGLGPHQHLCFIYETQEEQFAAAVPFLKSGLERGEKCFFVADEDSAAGLVSALRKDGTDIDRHLESGSLILANQPYAKPGRFDPDWCIAVLNRSIQGGADGKFSGLRTWLGEMTWALAEETPPESLIEFEAKINYFIRDHEVRALCQYNRDRFSPELLLGVIRTHPVVVYDALICENPYYVPPEELLKPNQAAREVDRLLNNIQAWQSSFDQMRALAARLQSVREEERAKVAREIHDELGQALTAIKIDFTSLLRDTEDQGLASSSRSQSILKLLDQAIQSVRRIGTELRPRILDDMGLAAALEWGAEDFQTRTGTKCEISLPDIDIRLDAERATALFRIFQETLTNVTRHAGATQVQVRLTKENAGLILEVRDNGRGMRDDQLSGKSSLGILGMRERVLLLGGTLTISSTLGSGTTVRVEIPDSNISR
jgi:signal transduction histidine kinase